MDKVKNEVWKTYPEFSFVEVSSFGRVRTLDRVVTRENGKLSVKGQILKQFENGHGYLKVMFGVNRKAVSRLVHRIVAQTFIPNPDNLPQVNHKDCDRTNNNVNNLEWCDASYNQKYREKYGVSNIETLGHQVIAINLTTLEVSRFLSQTEAGRELGVVQPIISKVIRGKRQQAGGYWFTNADDNAVEAVKAKFDDVVADKVEELMNDNEGKVEQQWLHNFINEMQPV